MNGKHRAAHRVAFEKANGPIPSGLNVLHRCDNRPCVNVGHLFLGTQRDNIRDAMTKGRMPQFYRERSGSKNPNVKLSDDETVWIGRVVRAGWSKAETGRVFGVTKERIGQIAKEQRYE